MQSGFSKPLQGYLTLQRNGPGSSSLILKWIPNALLQDSTSAQRYHSNVPVYMWEDVGVPLC